MEDGVKREEAKGEGKQVVVKRRSTGAGSVLDKIKVERCELE